MVPPLTLCAYMKKGPNLRWSLIQCSGGDEGDRTPDLLTASQALSQLSYAPVRKVLYGNSPADARTILENILRRVERARGRRDTRCPKLPAGRAPRAGGAAAARLSGFTPVAPGIPATKPAHLLRLGEIPRPWRLGQKQNRR